VNAQRDERELRVSRHLGAPGGAVHRLDLQLHRPDDHAVRRGGVEQDPREGLLHREDVAHQAREQPVPEVPPLPLGRRERGDGVPDERPLVPHHQPHHPRGMRVRPEDALDRLQADEAHAVEGVVAAAPRVGCSSKDRRPPRE
jgi:hypothetical protein